MRRSAEEEEVREQLAAHPFDVEVKLLKDRLPAHGDPMCYFQIELKSRFGAPRADGAFRTHLYMLLDVSASMNKPQKYPLLLEALGQMIDDLDEEQLFSLILFANGFDSLLSCQTGRNCRRVKHIVMERMRTSRVRFGRHTALSYALRYAIKKTEALLGEQPEVLNRFYVLTDGRLHDADKCCELTDAIRRNKIEVHSYGFGQDFDYRNMMRVMRGCRGRTVKPISNTQEAGRVFRHVVDLSRRILAENAHLELTFGSNVVPGNAFSLAPTEQLFDSDCFVSPSRFALDVGNLERDRKYVYLFECRLPERRLPSQLAGSSDDRVATLSCHYETREGAVDESRAISCVRVARAEDESEADPEVQRTRDAVGWLADQDDQEALLRSLEARLALAIEEQRNPEQIDAIREMIDKVKSGTAADDEIGTGVAFAVPLTRDG